MTIAIKYNDQKKKSNSYLKIVIHITYKEKFCRWLLILIEINVNIFLIEFYNLYLEYSYKLIHINYINYKIKISQNELLIYLIRLKQFQILDLNNKEGRHWKQK